MSHNYSHPFSTIFVPQALFTHLRAFLVKRRAARMNIKLCDTGTCFNAHFTHLRLRNRHLSGARQRISVGCPLCICQFSRKTKDTMPRLSALNLVDDLAAIDSLHLSLSGSEPLATLYASLYLRQTTHR